jgi:hypothetical protein
MKKVFDLIEEIQQRVRQFSDETDARPRAISLSPAAYRQLVELHCQENSIGNLVVGCRPLTSYETLAGTVSVIIDEMLGDTQIVVS